MAQIRKAEGQVEIRSHADKFFDAWARKPGSFPKMCPSKFTSVEIHEGDWHVNGTKYTVNYTMGNERGYVTKVVEEMDENNRSVTYSVVDGHIMKHYYQNLKDTMQVIPKGDGAGSIVKWSMEYEKKNEDAPDADVYVGFLLDCAKEMDANLCVAY